MHIPKQTSSQSIFESFGTPLSNYTILENTNCDSKNQNDFFLNPELESDREIKTGEALGDNETQNEMIDNSLVSK